MPEFDCIENAFRETGWNRARIAFLARFLVALIAVRTVCLTEIASVFDGDAQIESHYKRIQRFLRKFPLDFDALARLTARLVGVSTPWVLSIDRTNWKLGKIEVNILMLVLVHREIGFPLFWTVLRKQEEGNARGKAGSSNVSERIALMQRFQAVFPQKIAFLCGDREFGGAAWIVWIAWLASQQIDFRLRIKADTLMANSHGTMVSARFLFCDCAIGEVRYLPGRRRCLGQDLYVVGTRLIDGDYLIVLSNEKAYLSDYACRWAIETLFGALKTRGFNLEATHVTDPDRLEKLLALLSIAFTWAFVAGQWLTATKPLKLKKHGRPAKSIFRSGLDWLRRVLTPLSGKTNQDDLQTASGFLSCT
jgi:hypothetical protein